MKRVLVLFLITMVICSMLTGCVLNNIVAVISDTLFHIDGTVLTAANSEDGKTVYITHGENFTQDDIDFVLMLHGEKRNDKIPIDKPGRVGFECVLNAGKEGQPIFSACFGDSYIICAYLKPGALPYITNIWGDYKFDVTKYIWYKFTDSTQMLETINGARLTEDSYLLYNCTLEKDVVNNVEYNKTFKCYIKYEGEYSCEYVTSKMLLFFASHKLSNVLSETKHIAFPLYNGDAFGVYTDEGGIDYLSFSYNRIASDLGEHYGFLSPYFEVLEEHVNDEETVPNLIGIKLSDILDYINSGR